MEEIAKPRRTGRKRTSTVMNIRGHTVLKKNNYVLKGMSYEMGVFEQDQQQPSKKKKKKPPAVASKPKATRAQKPSEVARTLHNNSVKADILSKEAFRRDFIVQHKDVLEPFMNEATCCMVRDWEGHKKKEMDSYKQIDLVSQPDLVTGGDMRDYQLAGLNFMLTMHDQNLGMILGDEMGLGKTLQTISLFCHLKGTNVNTGPSLVVCPLSVLQSWCSEIAKWAPSLQVLRLHSSNPEEQDQQRHEMAHSANKYDVIVTTYDMVKVPTMMHMFNRVYFRYLVLDEGHKIKNGMTQVSQVVRKLHSENRLILTGTPLQNNLTELVSLLNFLHPDIINNFEAFEDAFDITNNHIDKEKMVESQKVLDLFMLRRLKVQVEKLMPMKIETKVYCPLSNLQRIWYKSILLKDLHLLAANDDGEGPSQGAAAHLKGMYMQLRKACIHPFLFPEAEPDISATTLRDIMGASGKVAVLDKLLMSLYKKGHRCVLFSQFTSMLDILADYCIMRGWSHFLFDGRVSRAKRNYFVNAFNAPKSQVFLFLMSTRSGSMGLNLQTADTCILFDSDMNPQMDLQAQARVHRIGQTKTVHVYRLVSGGTIEERIVQRAEKKLLLDQMVNRERAEPKSAKKDDLLTGSDMFRDLKFGSAAVFGDSSQNVLPTTKDLAYITDRKRSENDSGGKLKGGTSFSVDTYDVGEQLKSSQVFGGVNFGKIRDEQKKKSEAQIPKTLRGIATLQYELSTIGNRRKKKNRVVMVAGIGSGYGSASVPVLASNNYDLEHGESSVFGRELSSKSKEGCTVQKSKRVKPELVHQEWCQHCGDGGTLYCCDRCPIAAHKECFPDMVSRSHIVSCSHHWCVVCSKPANAAGGFLYPCQACPAAYCEDCLPFDNKGFRIIGRLDRFEEAGYDTGKMTAYIHCSSTCEEYSKEVWGYKPPSNIAKPCPGPIDVSSFFGGKNLTEKTISQGLDVETSGPLEPVDIEVAASHNFATGEEKPIELMDSDSKEGHRIHATISHKKQIAEIPAAVSTSPVSMSENSAADAGCVIV